MSLKAKAETTETMKVKRAFKGFIISLVTKHNTPATTPTNAELIDPKKVIVTLRDNASNMTIFSMSLERMYRTLKAGDRDLPKVLGTVVLDKTVAYDSTGNDRMQNLSLEFDTYEGDFDFIVETKDSIHVNTALTSFIEFQPIWSDKPMLYMPIYNDRALNQLNFDEMLGSGVEQLIILSTGALTTIAPDGYQNDIVRAGYSSSEQSEMYNANTLFAHTQLFQENPFQQNTKELILHDGEILGNCNVTIELVAAFVNNWVMVFKKILPNPNAEASLARAENRIDRLYDLVDSNL